MSNRARAHVSGVHLVFGVITSITSITSITCITCITRAALAEGTCAVEVQPPSAPDEWQIAARNVGAESGALASEDNDCDHIVVHVDDTGAWVELVTTSGAHAKRRVATPAELEPTVAAMLVRFPLDASKDASKDAKSAAGTSSPPNPPATSSGAKASLLLGFLVGLRVGFPHHFVSPMLGGYAGVALGHWELGIFGQWEMNYVSSSVPLPSGVQLYAIGAGVSLGRRLLVSDSLAMIVEGHLGGAVVNEEGNEATMDGIGGAQAEARVGAGIGITVPRSSSVHLRPMLSFDVAPTRFSKRGQYLDSQLPAPPQWGISLSVALESEAL